MKFPDFFMTNTAICSDRFYSEKSAQWPVGGIVVAMQETLAVHPSVSRKILLVLY